MRARLFDGARGGCYKLALSFFTCGAVAQLGARIDGIDEVAGSNPAGSTNFSRQILPNKICKIFFRRNRVCSRNSRSARTTSSRQQKSRRDAGATKTAGGHSMVADGSRVANTFAGRRSPRRPPLRKNSTTLQTRSVFLVAVVRSLEPAVTDREEDCAVVAWVVVAQAGAGKVRDVGF
jgi:hypothetical protein